MIKIIFCICLIFSSVNMMVEILLDRRPFIQYEFYKGNLYLFGVCLYGAILGFCILFL